MSEEVRHQVHVAISVSGALGDEIVGEGGQELVQEAVGGGRHLRVVFLGVRVCSLPGTAQNALATRNALQKEKKNTRLRAYV